MSHLNISGPSIEQNLGPRRLRCEVSEHESDEYRCHSIPDGFGDWNVKWKSFKIKVAASAIAGQ